MGVNRLEAAAGVLVLIVLLACGGAATTPETSADAKKVEIGKGDPPPGFKQMQTLEVVHGDGCGAYGEKGTFDGAYAMLRNEAARIKADYVQMMTVTEPYSDGQCAHNEYKITAVAYRKGKTKKAKAKAEEDEGDEIPKAGAKACVPGATQECLGPGACKGAQACRDDGSGYSACDCGNASTGSVQ